MRKITIEFDESESTRLLIMAVDQVLRDTEQRLKADQNIRIRWDKGLKSGLLTQKGNVIALLRRNL